MVLLGLQPVVLGTCKSCESKGGSCETCWPHVQHVTVINVPAVQRSLCAQLNVKVIFMHKIGYNAVNIHRTCIQRTILHVTDMVLMKSLVTALCGHLVYVLNVL